MAWNDAHCNSVGYSSAAVCNRYRGWYALSLQKPLNEELIEARQGIKLLVFCLVFVIIAWALQMIVFSITILEACNDSCVVC